MVLVYLGKSIATHNPNPLEESLSHCPLEELLDAKISHDEYPLLLDSLKALDFVKELTVIATCNRFELLFFIDEHNINETNIQELRKTIKSINKSDLEFDLITGKDAQQQFFRTFSGLNSGLIGEAEISSQIEIAFRQSAQMGYLGQEGLLLLEKAIDLRDLIEENIYKEQVSYCEVAISTALEKFEDKEHKKVVVLGSGSTAHKSLKTLVKLGYKPENIHLVHRISHSSSQISHIKTSPELEGLNFYRVKYGYHTDRAKDFVSDADLMISAIDARLPAMHFSQNYKLQIIDFSSKATCSFEEGTDLSNYASSSELDKYVRNYSRIRFLDERFQTKLKQAELTISAQVEKELQKAII